MKHVVVIALLLALFSCQQDGKNDLEFMPYFYEADSSPKIYVYQDSLNPLFEVFERVFVVEDEVNGKVVWIEKYNMNYRLLETFQFSMKHDLHVMNHLVSAKGKLINAELRDSTYYPLLGQSHFSSTFPSNVDSLIFHYDMKRSLLDKKNHFVFDDKAIETIFIQDTITTYAIDIRNQLEKKSQSISTTQFAKGIGKVQTTSANGKVNLRLTRILSEEEWKYISTK